jgi:hypothetical protein
MSKSGTPDAKAMRRPSGDTAGVHSALVPLVRICEAPVSVSIECRCQFCSSGGVFCRITWRLSGIQLMRPMSKGLVGL